MRVCLIYRCQHFCNRSLTSVPCLAGWSSTELLGTLRQVRSQSKKTYTPRIARPQCSLPLMTLWMMTCKRADRLLAICMPESMR